MPPTQIKTAACIGAGVIGSAWAARLAWNGIDVTVADPHPEAEPRMAEVLANAERAQAKLTMAPVAKRGTINLVREVAAAVADADFIQESAPEREDLKIKLLAEMDKHCRPDVLIGSSTSGLLPSKLQVGDEPPRALPGRASVQPGLPDAAGGGGRRREDQRRTSSGPRSFTPPSACIPCMCARRSMPSSPTG